MLRRNSPVVRFARPLYRRLRTTYLRRRYPRGHFIHATGVPVFCDFSDPSYVWYDADSDYLRFHKTVFDALLDRSVGDVFIDIGAHFGFYSAYMAAALRRRHRVAHIIAIEPDRRHFRCLEQTASAAQGGGIAVEPVASAISNRNGVVTLYKSQASCLHSYPDAGAVECYEVPAHTLDSLVESRLRSGQRVALIKLDVDGAEPFVMEGWDGTLRRHAPLVLTEFSPAALAAAGREPGVLFRGLCDRFSVVHVDHHHSRVRPVRGDDYASIAGLVGDGVTDLVLAPVTVSLAGLPYSA